MAMGAADPAYSAGRDDARLQELQRENETLREQLRRLAAQHTVARGALTEAAAEKDAAERIAHQVVVEERATRAAVEVAGSGISTTVVFQILNFFMLLVLLVGLFAWLPRAVADRIPGPTTVTTPGTVIVPR